MSISAICSHCKKTISVDKRPNLSCPECGGFVNLLIMQRHGLIIDKETEKTELAIASDYFKNAEFLSASEHFKKALKANKNSYIAQYFISVCEIYLNEAVDIDVIECAVRAVTSALTLMVRAGAALDDRQKFVTAMLGEIKIIIINRLKSFDEIYEYDIAEYREKLIPELKKVLELFKSDSEAMMTYLPNISRNILEIADVAIALCRKAVQTVAVGEDLVSPTEGEYNSLVSLCNEFNAYAVSLFHDYDMYKQPVDFTQCDLLNDNVGSRLQKFDAANKANAKKNIIGNIAEYNSIMADCKKAIEFIYRKCFKSMCDVDSADRLRQISTGLSFLTRFMTPSIIVSEKKRVEILIEKQTETERMCDISTEFLQAECDHGNAENARAILREYYAKLYDILDMYFTPEYERYSKRFNKIKSDYGGDEYSYYERFLFASAMCAAPSLNTYVKFDLKDKNRTKSIKLCRTAAEAFLMLRDYDVAALEQSEYSALLDVYNAVMLETGV